MPTTDRPLLDFDCLSFDCYGTLVDWEGGIYRALAPLYTQLPENHAVGHDRLNVLKAFIRSEDTVASANPTAPYTEILAQTYGQLAEDLGVAASEDDKAKFGTGVADWPIYPDTLDALERLHTHFKLVILSNVDHGNFQRTIERQFKGFRFDAIYTAEDIGSYKPDLRNFEYLISHSKQDLGIDKEKIIHTAQALHHDHVPATSVGLATAWIERGEDVPSAIGGQPEDLGDRVAFSWRYKNLGEMADAVELLANGSKG